MIFFDHIVYGLSPLYPLESQQYQGFIGIIEKFRESQEKYNNLNYDKIEEAFRTVKSIYDANSQTECLSQFINIEGDQLLFRTSIESIFKDIDFNKIIKLIEKAKDVVIKTSRKIENKLYKTLRNTANNKIRNSFLLIFIMILFFSVTNLIILFLYYLKQNKHFKILYIINWNILMLLMIF